MFLFIESIQTLIYLNINVLLNVCFRKEFAASPVVLSGGSVSIPSWQREEGSSPSPQEKEEGNGSNTNGSDSSLEMIKD
jgi:hypothetical protein